MRGTFHLKHLLPGLQSLVESTEELLLCVRYMGHASEVTEKLLETHACWKPSHLQLGEDKLSVGVDLKSSSRHEGVGNDVANKPGTCHPPHPVWEDMCPVEVICVLDPSIRTILRKQVVEEHLSSDGQQDDHIS